MYKEAFNRLVHQHLLVRRKELAEHGRRLLTVESPVSSITDIGHRAHDSITKLHNLIIVLSLFPVNITYAANTS